jgi:hypothetical protein
LVGTDASFGAALGKVLLLCVVLGKKEFPKLGNKVGVELGSTVGMGPVKKSETGSATTVKTTETVSKIIP